MDCKYASGMEGRRQRRKKCEWDSVRVEHLNQKACEWKRKGATAAVDWMNTLHSILIHIFPSREQDS